MSMRVNKIKAINIQPKDFSGRAFFPGTEEHPFHAINTLNKYTAILPSFLYPLIFAGILFLLTGNLGSNDYLFRFHLHRSIHSHPAAQVEGFFWSSHPADDLFSHLPAPFYASGIALCHYFSSHRQSDGHLRFHYRATIPKN